MNKTPHAKATRLIQYSIATLALLGATGLARAQSLNQEARMTHDAFVLQEPIEMRVEITNLGGSPYIVDDYGAHKENTLSISLKSQEFGYLKATTKTPFGDLMIMPGESEEITADLRKIFPVNNPGRYYAQVTIKRGAEVQATRQMMFDIVNGIEIGSVTRPLPEYDTIFRKYTLLYWPRNQVEELFLRIDETPPGQCVGLLKLGNVVRFTEPRIEFTGDGSVLSVTHQSSRDLFVRTTIKSDRLDLSITDRQQLLNPNLSPMRRAALEEGEPEEKRSQDGFSRRVRPPKARGK